MNKEKIDAMTKAQLVDIIVDVLASAVDWRAMKPESLREEDYVSGVWQVADDILDLLKEKGFEWPTKE